MTDDSTRIVPVEKLKTEQTCPKCDCAFDTDVWENVGVYYFSRSGGKKTYECPTDNCDGIIHIVI